MSFISSLLTSQSPLAFLLVILLPSIPTLIAQFRRWRQSHNHQHDPRPRRPYQLIALLSFHTLYQAIQLFRPSYNVFHSHGIPITVDVPTVRRALSRYYASSSHDSAEYERLLNRLSNLDYRLIYARFGHRPIAECGWCTSFDDFALVASPSVIAPYAISGVLLGVLGWKMVSGAEGPERAEKLRGTFGWFVGVLAVGDVVGRYVWDMRVVEGYCVQLDALLHPLRRLLLLLFPLIYTLLPLTPSPASSIQPFIPSLTRSSAVIRITALARTAIGSDPTLRDQWTSIGRQGEEERSVAREDEHVLQAADRAGLAGSAKPKLGEGPPDRGLRAQAAAWVKEQWVGLIRVGPGGQTGQST